MARSRRHSNTHGDRRDNHLDPYANVHADSDSNPNGHGYCPDSHAHANWYAPNFYIDVHTYANCYPSNFHTHADWHPSNFYTHIHTYANWCHSGMHAKSATDAASCKKCHS